MAKKRHRTIDPRKARIAAGGGSFYDRIIPSLATRTACSRCGTYTTLIGTDGACLKCRLQARKAAPDNAA